MGKYFENMRYLFNPSSVAVVGASYNQGKLGFHVMKSLIRGGFGGRIFPINPKAKEIMGVRCYPSLQSCTQAIDIAIIVVPAGIVPTVFKDCTKKNVKGIVLITAGFKEIEDPSGTALHEELAQMANRAEIPVIGPNTFGMINFHRDLNASFTPEFSRLKKGSIALVSQSGGMSHLIGFLSLRDNVGFSKIVGLGNRLNVDFAQMLEYLMTDHETSAIALYVEGIEQPKALLEKAKEVSALKPIVAYKTGSAHVGDEASLSHTGSVAGQYDVYVAGFKQAGVTVANDSQEFLDIAKAFAHCPLPQGKGVAVLSGQAGPAMAGSDICEKYGLDIVRFSKTTQDKINRLLPPLALRTNPVDMGPAWYDASAIRGIVEAVMHDEGVHGILLFMMFASANVDAVDRMADLLMEWKQKKPVISCILSPPGIWDLKIQELEERGALVNYCTPERASRAMVALCKRTASGHGWI